MEFFLGILGLSGTFHVSAFLVTLIYGLIKTPVRIAKIVRKKPLELIIITKYHPKYSTFSFYPIDCYIIP